MRPLEKDVSIREGL
jgi:polyamine oxidase